MSINNMMTKIYSKVFLVLLFVFVFTICFAQKEMVSDPGIPNATIKLFALSDTLYSNVEMTERRKWMDGRDIFLLRLQNTGISKINMEKDIDICDFTFGLSNTFAVLIFKDTLKERINLERHYHIVDKIQTFLTVQPNEIVSWNISSDLIYDIKELPPGSYYLQIVLFLEFSKVKSIPVYSNFVHIYKRF